jgi:hypothetical protein
MNASVGGKALPARDGSLTVAVATPLNDKLCDHIESLEPRVQMVRDQMLLPPMRQPADFVGDPRFSPYRATTADV